MKEERWKEETTRLWRELDKARERLEEYNAQMQTREEEEEEVLTFLQALDNKDRGKVLERHEEYNVPAQMRTLDEEYEEALCLQNTLHNCNNIISSKTGGVQNSDANLGGGRGRGAVCTTGSRRSQL